MYTVKAVQTVETVLPPKKLLYLCDAAVDGRAGQIADCLGRVYASYPFTSPRYGSELAQVWLRYARHADPDEREARPGAVRTRYANKIVDELPSIVAPPVPLQHCKAVVALMVKVAGITAFNRTGDQLVYKVILSEIPRVEAAELSFFEVPYKAAGAFYGDSANRRVRALFERNIDEDLKSTVWETTTGVEQFILFFTLLFETGADLGTTLCCNHELAYYTHRTQVAPFCWNGRLGVVYKGTLVWCNPDALFPIPTLAMHFLELAALAKLEGSDAAASILCAVKTPERARLPARKPARKPPRLSPKHARQQVTVRDSLYRLVHVSESNK